MSAKMINCKTCGAEITEAGVSEADRYLALNGLLLVALCTMAPSMFY